MAPLQDGISPFARELSVLLVEDDAPTRKVVAAMLRGLFRELHEASDGLEGLAAFRQRAPRIVLTDCTMPGLSGLAMTEEIRKADPKVPVIFITASMDTDLLVRAINLGIAAFIPKPVTRGNLCAALALVVGLLENESLQRRMVEQELALLQLRERYHEHQQALAFRKEVSILENDYLCRSFTGAPGSGRGEWLAQVLYVPHDIMCGDSYSLRALPGGMLVFLADAMGKGLAASLTTSLAVYTCNLLADAVVPGEPFRFRDFVEAYTTLMTRRLLEDEVLSLCLAWLPADGPGLETAAFGMPPILVEGGAAGQLRCDNPPLSAFSESFRTTVHDLGPARRVLLYTDGLNEAVTADGSLYREHLDADFKASTTRDRFTRAFRDRVAVPDDDVTVLILARVDGEEHWAAPMTIPSRLEDVERACQDVEDRLEACGLLEADARYEFAMAVRESLLNAYEHGSLEIPGALKRALLDNGSYLERITEEEDKVDRTISLVLSGKSLGGARFLQVTIQDQGPGFQPPRTWAQEPDSLGLSGRGLKMVQKYTDAFYFNDQGNRITLLKACQGEAHADRSDESTGAHDHGEHQDHG